MKMVIIEPLGVEEGKLLAMAKESLGDRVEIVYYNTKTTDTAELIERGKDAEIIVVSNLPLNAQVIEGCRNLKLLAVAFTPHRHGCVQKERCHGMQLRRIFHLRCGGSGVRHVNQPVQKRDSLRQGLPGGGHQGRTGRI